MTETESFNIAFDLSKISLFRRWNITKSYCIYYECEKHVRASYISLALIFCAKIRVRSFRCSSFFVKGHVQVGYSLVNAFITPLFHYQPFTIACLRHCCIYIMLLCQKETTISDRRLSFLFVLVSFQYSLFTFH